MEFRHIAQAVTAIIAVVTFYTAFAADLVYDVAEGETAYVTTDINATTAGVDELVKTGKGTLVISNQVGATRNFKRLDVRGGRVNLAKGSDSFHPDIHVCSNAIFEVKVGGGLRDTTVIDVDRGGTMSLGGKEDTIAGFRGAGVVTNWNNVTVTLTLTKGPHLFSGRAVTTGSARYEVYQWDNKPESAIVVGAKEAFRSCTLRLGWGSYTANTNLLFAGGIGSFVINKLDFEAANRVVFLEDLDGKPVTLYAGPYNGNSDGNVRPRGRGTYLALYSNGVMGDVNACKGFEGWFGTAGANVHIGGKGSKPDYSTIAGLLMTKTYGSSPRLQFLFYDCEPLRVTCPFVARSGGFIDMHGSFIFDKPDTSGLQISGGFYSNLVVNAGRMAFDQESGFSFGKDTPETKLVVNGGIVCGSPTTTPVIPSTTKIAWPQPLRIPSSKRYASIVINGGEFFMREYVPHRVYVYGGRFVLSNGLYPNVGTADDPSIFLFDGGGFRYNAARASTTFEFVTSDYQERSRIRVGAKGMVVDTTDHDYLWTDTAHNVYFYLPIETATGVAQDGGVDVRGGAGHLRFTRPLAINGPFRIRDCTLDLADAERERTDTSPWFGTGDMVLGSVQVRFRGNVTHVITNRWGTADGAKVRLADSPTVRLRESTARTAPVFELGPIVREKGSALFLWDACSVSAYDPDVSGTVRTKTAPTVEDAATGLLSDPYVSVLGSSGYRLGLLGYDTAADRFVAFTNYTEGVVAGTVARVSSAPVTLSAGDDVAVKALVLGITDETGSLLTVDEGAKIRVGNGTAPAKVVCDLHSNSRVLAVNGSGTIDFGTSEGVIVAPGSSTVQFNTKFSGSNGLSIVHPFLADTGYVALLGASDYTGGTIVSGALVSPRNSRSFGYGKVVLRPGQLSGGRIWGEIDVTIPNDIEAAGFGPTVGDSGQYGAICASQKTQTYTGAIELVERTRVRAVASTAELVFAGPVSGDALQVYGGSGKVTFEHANSYTGGTYVARTTLRLRGAGTLGTGKLTLDAGTLELAGREKRTIANDIDGYGTVLIADKGDVSFKGEMAWDIGANLALKLGARRATVNSLNGFSSVTTTCASGTTLCVTDDEDDFTGTVGEGVTIVKGAFPRTGTAVILR